MIYTASLALPVVKAFGKQVMQSNINKICELMSLDPDTSNMDVVMFGPKDMIGPKLVKIENAIAIAHPDVCIIYIYQKDADKNLIDINNKYKCKSINKNTVREAFEEFVGDHQVKQGKRQVTSADFEEEPELSPISQEVISKDPEAKKKKTERVFFGSFARKSQKPVNSGTPEADDETLVDLEDGELDDEISVKVNTSGETVSKQDTHFDIPKRDRDMFAKHGETPMDTQKMSEEPLPDLSKFFSANEDNEENEDEDFTLDFGDENGEDADGNKLEDKPVPMPSFLNPMENVKPMETEPHTPTFAQSVDEVQNYEDWTLLKEKLNRDIILNDLIKENSEYAGLISMIDVLSKRIETVWRDTTLSPDEKFEKIKEIGLEKSTLKASTNSMSAQKVITMVSDVVLVAKRTVETKLKSIDEAMYKIASSDTKLQDTSHIDAVIEERTKIQMDLLSMAREIVDLYTRVEDVVVEEIQDLDSKLPSASAFINNQMSPIGTQIFTPTNTAVLANRLMKALQENKVVASSLEISVNTVIEQLFKLCERDEEIIQYLQDSVNLLKANRVEDAVIADTLLKNLLRLYTGMDNTGRSATAITWCGVLSRRQNSLLIDLTGRSKFREYGITPISLDEFMDKRIEQQFLCVESDHILDSEELQELVNELKLRLNYYPCVNIIVAPEDNLGLSQLSEEAKCVHYITDCSPKSIEFMKEVIRNHTTGNVARKLITIDTPVSPLMIADNLNIDPTSTKLITLPAVPTIRACALRRDRPYEYMDVVNIFEEAFR